MRSAAGRQASSWKVSARVLEEEAMHDVAEIAAYDRIARAYLDILHQGFVATVLAHCPARARVLEVGAGTGWISIGLARLDPSLSLVATDLSPSMLEVAQQNARREGVAEQIDFRLADGKRLPFDDDAFDAVHCHNMLHHVPEPRHVVAEMLRVVRDDGAFVARDLVRVARWAIPLHVHGLGLRYDATMKREYRDSIRAALSWREWRALAAAMGFDRSAVSRQFVTHQMIARPAWDCREQTSFASLPLLGRLYLRRPPGRPGALPRAGAPLALRG